MLLSESFISQYFVNKIETWTWSDRSWKCLSLGPNNETILCYLKCTQSISEAMFKYRLLIDYIIPDNKYMMYPTIIYLEFHLTIYPVHFNNSFQSCLLTNHNTRDRKRCSDVFDSREYLFGFRFRVLDSENNFAKNKFNHDLFLFCFEVRSCRSIESQLMFIWNYVNNAFARNNDKISERAFGQLLLMPILH